jgi:arginyl-tRNA synthetase
MSAQGDGSVSNTKTAFSQAVSRAMEKIGLTPDTIATVSEKITIEHPQLESHGEWATNLAMITWPVVREQQPELLEDANNPRSWAGKLLPMLEDALVDQGWDSAVFTLEVAGPGFINVKFATTWWEDWIQSWQPDWASALRAPSPQKIIVEFTDPNPFKELHIGHLYSNTVGEAIARLFELRGHQVQRVCYQGDVGMHVAKSIWGLQLLLDEQFPGKTRAEQLAELGKQPLSTRVKTLGQAYALGSQRFEAEPTLQPAVKRLNTLCFLAAQDLLKEQKPGWQPRIQYEGLLAQPPTENERSETKLLYTTGRAWSLEYFNSVYTRMGMQFEDFYFESEVAEYGLEIVRAHLADGIFEESKGAVIFPGSKHGLHDRVFINSLGLPTYECKELGLAPAKFDRFPFDRSVIITGNEISEYFKVLLKAMSLTHPDLAAKTTHLSHGMVRLPAGKMSSRTGNIITGEGVLDQAHGQILPLVTEHEVADPEVAAEAIGVGAMKYAFLKNNIGGDIAFDFETSLKFSGNSGPYLQYTLARCLAVLKKSQVVTVDGLDISWPGAAPTDGGLTAAEEVALVRWLGRASDSFAAASDQLAPHVVCNYLFELAQRYNALYQSLPILTPTVNMLRVWVTYATAQTLRQGLEVLGIRPLVEM